jgi:hypothetical protein
MLLEGLDEAGVFGERMRDEDERGTVDLHA